MMSHIMFLFSFVSGGVSNVLDASAKPSGAEHGIIVVSVFLFFAYAAFFFFLAKWRRDVADLPTPQGIKREVSAADTTVLSL